MAQEQVQPAANGEAVTPNDSTTVYSRGVWVGTGGDLAVTMYDSGQSVTFPNVQSGSLLPIRVSKVLSTGTTASDIVVIW